MLWSPGPSEGYDLRSKQWLCTCIIDIVSYGVSPHILSQKPPCSMTKNSHYSDPNGVMENWGASDLVDLTAKALRMFDELLSRRKLFYAESRPEIVQHEGFLVSRCKSCYQGLETENCSRQFEFRQSPVLTKKPILPRDAKERSGNGGPFLNPDPDFVVATIGHHHVLELNMYSMFRPMFVLHTREFAPQTDDLDVDDVSAARNVMASLQGGSGPQMMLYNCGVDAGASQGHKHMQIVPLPSSFKLYPELADSTEGELRDPAHNL